LHSHTRVDTRDTSIIAKTHNELQGRLRFIANAAIYLPHSRVNFKYLLLLRTVKFYKRLYFKSGLLHDVFWSFMIFNRDECMKSVFIPLHKAISNLMSHFYDYVFGNV